MKVREERRSLSLMTIQNIVEEIQESATRFYREHRATYADISQIKEQGVHRIKLLVRSLDLQLQHALLTMYRGSLASFRRLIEYLSLGMTLDRRDNTQFDLLLPRSLYVTRHKAMITHFQIPINMTKNTHPHRLLANKTPDMTRRAIFIYRAVSTLTDLFTDSTLPILISRHAHDREHIQTEE
jgi:hypothetical protein